MPTHLALISLGSNIEPQVYLPRAFGQLCELGEVTAVSTVWESAPIGTLNQPRFCNAALLLLTSLSVESLCNQLRLIEANLGRLRDPLDKNGPRTIDLDLSMYDDCAGEYEGRVLPDPDLLTRRFVALPLAEVAPDYRHPNGLTLAQIAEGLERACELLRRDDIVLSR